MSSMSDLKHSQSGRCVTLPVPLNFTQTFLQIGSVITLLYDAFLIQVLVERKIGEITNIESLSQSIDGTIVEDEDGHGVSEVESTGSRKEKVEGKSRRGPLCQLRDCTLNVRGLNREEFFWVRRRFGCVKEIFDDREGFECRMIWMSWGLKEDQWMWDMGRRQVLSKYEARLDDLGYEAWGTGMGQEKESKIAKKKEIKKKSKTKGKKTSRKDKGGKKRKKGKKRKGKLVLRT
ncbi:hypothetical protein ACHWQZ_G013892 [Mnemiopsis leidyi]